MNYQDKISTIVEEALTEKTFSLEIITKIKALKDDFEAVTKENVNLFALNTDLAKGNADLTQKNNQLYVENEEYRKREDALAKKEKEAEKKEYELTFQTKRGDEIKELFGIVFKNPTVQSNVFRNTQKPVENGSYMSNVNETEAVTETIV